MSKKFGAWVIGSLLLVFSNSASAIVECTTFMEFDPDSDLGMFTTNVTVTKKGKDTQADSSIPGPVKDRIGELRKVTQRRSVREADPITGLPGEKTTHTQLGFKKPGGDEASLSIYFSKTEGSPPKCNLSVGGKVGNAEVSHDSKDKKGEGTKDKPFTQKVNLKMVSKNSQTGVTTTETATGQIKYWEDCKETGNPAPPGNLVDQPQDVEAGFSNG